MAVSGSFPGHLWAAFHGRLHTDPTAIRWQEIKKNFQAVVEEARTTPETARQLFNFCTMYRRDNDEVIQGVRSNFTELGIPSDYLSP